MKKLILLSSIGLFSLQANATFSLIAYDENSQQYGAAFASCVQEKPDFDIANYVNAISPNGIVTTQALVDPDNINLKNADAMIRREVHGKQIIDWLIKNDQNGHPYEDFRQYLVLNKVNGGPVEGNAYTGEFVQEIKTQYVEHNLVAAGNISALHTVSTLKDGYLNSHEENFAYRLLDGLTSVRNAGLGDLRCTKTGVSSLTAFVKVGGSSWFYNSQNGEDAVTGLEHKMRGKE